MTAPAGAVAIVTPTTKPDSAAREMAAAIAAAVAHDEEAPAGAPAPSSSWGMTGVGVLAGSIGAITLLAVPFLVVPVLPRAK